MIDGVDLPTAPTQPRRFVRRALTVAGVAAGAWLAVSLAATANAQTPTDDIPSALQGVSESVGQTLGDTVDAAQPATQAAVRIVDPVVAVAAPVVEQAAESVAPVAQAAGPVVEQAVDVAAPIVDSVTDAAAPVLDEVTVISAPILDSGAPIVEEVAVPIVEGVAPIVDAAMPVLVVTAPVVDAVTSVAETTAAVAAPIAGAVAEAVASQAPADGSLVGVPAPSSMIVQDLLQSAVDVAVITDFTVGSPTSESVGAGNALLANVFTSGTTPRTERDSAPGATPGSASLLATGAPIGGLPEPWAPPAPGAPGPAGAPGCPGQSGSGSGGSGSLHVAATTPFGPQRGQTSAQSADGDHAAALLTRCDEPGSSPD
jgi:hypothetical protein